MNNVQLTEEMRRMLHGLAHKNPNAKLKPD